MKKQILKETLLITLFTSMFMVLFYTGLHFADKKCHEYTDSNYEYRKCMNI